MRPDRPRISRTALQLVKGSSGLIGFSALIKRLPTALLPRGGLTGRCDLAQTINFSLVNSSGYISGQGRSCKRPTGAVGLLSISAGRTREPIFNESAPPFIDARTQRTLDLRHAVVIAANAGTWPAEGHGMSGAPDRTLGLSAAYRKRALPNILRQVLDATIAAIVAPFQRFGPRLLSGETLDATVSNVSSALL
jgi:hypothetical protein